MLNPDLYFWPWPCLKVGSMCRQVMHSCITLEILRSIDLLFLLPNLLHSTVICVWSACSMPVCIHASLFTVRLFVGALLSGKKKIFLVFHLPIYAVCQDPQHGKPYNSYPWEAGYLHRYDSSDDGYPLLSYLHYRVETSIWYLINFLYLNVLTTYYRRIRLVDMHILGYG